MMTREEAREQLTGYIPSLTTPFCRDGSIDYDGLRSFVDFVIEAGSRAVMITPGDSLYTLLSDREVAEVNKAVVEYTAGRALVIAAENMWWTGQTVEFAQHMREVGADLLMVHPPDWALSCTAETFVAHYAAAAEHMPIMILTASLVNQGIPKALEIIRRLRDEIPNVVAVKDDWCDAFGRKLSLEVYGHWAVIAGGQKQNHLNAYPYGMDGYLSCFVSFMPRVSQEYWRAIEAKDLDQATRIIAEYDMPYFEFIGTCPGGFDAGVHGTMELFGVAQRWRRSPYHSLTDEEMERLRGFFQERGWL